MGAPASVRKDVAASGTASVYQLPGPFTVGIQPGSGGTMTCKVRVHPDDALVDIDSSTASFAAAAYRVVNGPVYEVQFGAVTADGAGSVAF